MAFTGNYINQANDSYNQANDSYNQANDPNNQKPEGEDNHQQLIYIE
jgi:hypothetical protein